MRYSYGETTTTTAAEISKNFGFWQNRAIAGPVVVTYHGRPNVVLISAEQWALWKAPASNDEDAVPAYETSCSAILERIEEGFIAFDRNLVSTTANLTCCTILEKPREALTGAAFGELFPQLTRTMLYERLREAAGADEPETFSATFAISPERELCVKIFPFPKGVGVLVKNRSDEARVASSFARSASLREALRRMPDLVEVEVNIVESDGSTSWISDPEAKGGDALEGVLAGGAPAQVRVDLLVGGHDRRAADAVISPIRGDNDLAGALIVLRLALPVQSLSNEPVAGGPVVGGDAPLEMPRYGNGQGVTRMEGES